MWTPGGQNDGTTQRYCPAVIAVLRSFHLNRTWVEKMVVSSGLQCIRRGECIVPTVSSKWLGALWLVAATAVACSQTTMEQIVGPSDVRCQLDISSPTPVPSAAQAFTLSLTTSRECTWSNELDANWLSVEPRSGQGEAILSVTAAENPQGRTRVASLAINEQKVAITQEAAPCHFSVAPTGIAMRAEGGRASVQLTTLEGCSWTTRTSHPWARVLSGSGGDSSRLIELTVDSNPGDDRSGEVRIADIPVTISQDSISESARGCPYSMSRGSANFASAGGTGAVRLHTRPTCAWGAASSQSWVVIVSRSNAIGTEDIQYRVEPNPSSQSRTATITAGGRRHIVRQAGN
jgi:hypothetical protein